MPHQPAYHILDNNFPDENNGLALPARELGCPNAGLVLDVAPTSPGQETLNTIEWLPEGLRITNLDRTPPPHYQPGDYPRSGAYNGNVFQITAEPAMPIIEVVCETTSFDPADSPLCWRLQCRSVICRHTNHGQYRYGGACEVLDAEWQGRSTAATFRLFEPNCGPTLTYEFNEPPGVVVGGDAILSVAARPPGCSAVLLDYAHLRIGGTNPGQADAIAYVRNVVAARDPNILPIILAVFAHEANYRQFAAGTQTQAHVRFRLNFGHHVEVPPQPDCNVLFDWPDDPSQFPFTTFDFGVGISQWTRVHGQRITPAIAWDWRANITIGINRLMSGLRTHYEPTLTWRQWAHRAWAAYNGSGPQAAAYANAREASPEGQQVATTPVPTQPIAMVEARNLADLPTPGPPPAWPPANIGQAP